MIGRASNVGPTYDGYALGEPRKVVPFDFSVLFFFVMVGGCGWQPMVPMCVCVCVRVPAFS